MAVADPILVFFFYEFSGCTPAPGVCPLPAQGPLGGRNDHEDDDDDVRN